MRWRIVALQHDSRPRSVLRAPMLRCNMTPGPECARADAPLDTARRLWQGRVYYLTNTPPSTDHRPLSSTSAVGMVRAWDGSQTGTPPRTAPAGLRARGTPYPLPAPRPPGVMASCAFYPVSARGNRGFRRGGLWQRAAERGRPIQSPRTAGAGQRQRLAPDSRPMPKGQGVGKGQQKHPFSLSFRGNKALLSIIF